VKYIVVEWTSCPYKEGIKNIIKYIVEYIDIVGVSFLGKSVSKYL
jgi:hypothetical protein